MRHFHSAEELCLGNTVAVLFRCDLKGFGIEIGIDILFAILIEDGFPIHRKGPEGRLQHMDGIVIPHQFSDTAASGALPDGSSTAPAADFRSIFPVLKPAHENTAAFPAADFPGKSIAVGMTAGPRPKPL